MTDWMQNPFNWAIEKAGHIHLEYDNYYDDLMKALMYYDSEAQEVEKIVIKMTSEQDNYRTFMKVFVSDLFQAYSLITYMYMEKRYREVRGY
jgi:hypothetical protein